MERMKIEVHSPTIRRKEMDAVLTVLVEEKIGPGEQSKRLVESACSSISTDTPHFDYAIAMRSPAMALTLALRAFGIDTGGDGSAAKRAGALVSALSPRYYAQAITDAGFVPIIADVELDSALVSTATLKNAIEKCPAEVEPRCVVLHETLGFLPESSVFEEISLPFIEDCSASFGGKLSSAAQNSGGAAGFFGALSILGLEEHDLLTAGGGALLFAAGRRNGSVLRGLSKLPPEYGLPDMNAAMALVQFREAAKNGEKRAEIARLYTDAALRGGRHKMFSHPENFEYNNYAFALVLESGMKDVAAWAKKKEIEVELAFADSLLNTLSESAGYGSSVAGAPASAGTAEICPAASSLAMRTAIFPLYPRLGAEAAQKVARLIQTLP